MQRARAETLRDQIDEPDLDDPAPLECLHRL
jgi:hypothetical protein